MQSNSDESDADHNTSKYFTKSSELSDTKICEEETPASSSAACVNDKESSAIGEYKASTDSVSRDDYQANFIDDQTEEYSLDVDTEWTHSPVHYTAADFESVDESDDDDDLEVANCSFDEDEGSDMGKCVSKRKNSGHEVISDNVST